jgi:hypothetical protein
MEIVGRWWNGSWGRLSRQDVFLRAETVWEVEARRGGAEGRSRTWRFHTQEEARAFVARCLEAGVGEWRELPAAPRDTGGAATGPAGTP